MKTDSGTYWCGVVRFGRDSFQEVHLIVTDDRGEEPGEHHHHQSPPTHNLTLLERLFELLQVTGYSGGTVIIYCEYSYQHDDNQTSFSDGNSKDTIITGLKNTWQHSGRFSLYDNTEGNYFKVIIRQLTKQDEGTYRCGVDKPTALGSYTVVELKVEEDDCCEKSVTETVYLGGEATISCNYPEDREYSTKHFCKEQDRFICNSMNSNNNKMYDNSTEKFYSVTISDLTEDDTGTYWCGVETSRTEDRYIALITQVKLRVISTSVVIMVSVSLVVLLLVISLIIVYRWKYNKATGSVSSTHRVSPDKGNNEGGCHGDGDYEEIKERPLQSDSDSAPTTIYATANLPTSHSDSPHYASINFHKNPSGPNEARVTITKEGSCPNEARVTITKEGTSSCDYATVNLGKPVLIMVCVSLTVLVVGLILLLIYKWRRDRKSSNSPPSDYSPGAGQNQSFGRMVWTSVGLVVMVTVLGLVLLLFYRQRRGTRRTPPPPPVSSNTQPDPTGELGGDRRFPKARGKWSGSGRQPRSRGTDRRSLMRRSLSLEESLERPNCMLSGESWGSSGAGAALNDGVQTGETELLRGTWD
ncbi:hypothetical protein J4Q44_G00290870 [Coregonus suidteri]|uniref:Ig-like domain-containing protein n=1 Tax=Coregonus suidteri TaxID=861788 RepID=A0AAN8L4F0_9TELE